MGVGSISLLSGTAKAAVMFPAFSNISYMWTWKQKTSILSMVEQLTVVVACCLPAFRVYLRKLKSRATVWPRESELVGGGGGARSRTVVKGQRNSGAIGLDSFHSEGEILADGDREILPVRGSSAPALDGGGVSP